MDICFISPLLDIAGFKIQPLEMEIELPLAKYMKGLNWLRYKVIYTSEKVIKFVNKAIDKMQSNIESLTEQANNAVEYEKSTIA